MSKLCFQKNFFSKLGVKNFTLTVQIKLGRGPKIVAYHSICFFFIEHLVTQNIRHESVVWCVQVKHLLI